MDLSEANLLRLRHAIDQGDARYFHEDLREAVLQCIDFTLEVGPGYLEETEKERNTLRDRLEEITALAQQADDLEAADVVQKLEDLVGV